DRLAARAAHAENRSIWWSFDHPVRHAAKEDEFVSFGVALDARIPNAVWGGVQQVAIGLAHGLAKLEDTDERYSFLVYKREGRWLEPFLGPNSRLVEMEYPGSFANRVRKRIGAVGPERAGRFLRPRSPFTLHAALAAADARVVHFTYPATFQVKAP